MKKSTVFLIAILLLAGCTADDGDSHFPDRADPTTTAVSPYKVSYKDAVANLFAVLEVIDYKEGETTRAYQPPRMIRDAKALRLSPMQTRSGNSMPDTLLYLVNFDDSGYAIISADIRVEPVLAMTDKVFSFTPVSDVPLTNLSRPPAVTLPPNYWSDAGGEDADGGYENDLTSAEELFGFIKENAVNYAIGQIFEADSIAETNQTRAIPDWNWNGITWVTSERIYPLLKTIWGQGWPYNTCISKHLDPSGRSSYASGCVAIAMTQIMLYHQYPKKFNGVNLRWDLASGVGIYKSGGIQWGTPLQQEWASYLSAIVGIEARTKFGINSSGSTTIKALLAFEKFGYKVTTRNSPYSYDAYGGNTTPSVHIYARQSLRKGNPVYYRGTRKGGSGHAWVVDGFWHVYDKNNSSKKMPMQHVNFGWGGLHNGWYKEGMFCASRTMVSYVSGLGDKYSPDGPNAGYNYYYVSTALICEKP